MKLIKFKPLAAALAAVLLLSGCEALSRAPDAIGDKKVVDADTPESRVLRAHFLVAAMSRLGASRIKQPNEALMLLVLNRNAREAVQSAGEVAYRNPPLYFETEMADYTERLVRAAGVALPLAQLRQIFGGILAASADPTRASALRAIRGVIGGLGNNIDEIILTGAMKRDVKVHFNLLVTQVPAEGEEQQGRGIIQSDWQVVEQVFRDGCERLVATAERSDLVTVPAGKTKAEFLTETYCDTPANYVPAAVPAS